MKISVLVPAYNEEKFISGCLESIRAAEQELGEPVEIVVCLNRCTDSTEEIARSFDAVIAREDAKNIARIRNAAIKATTGDVVVTIDADSRMSKNMLTEVRRLLSTGKFVGGGSKIHPERMSLGIFVSGLVILYFAIRYGIKSAGLFWTERKYFDAVGGFDESLHSLEDLNFANRLAAYGKTKNLKYGTTWRASITTSCRKFDKFGDWFLVRNPKTVANLFEGTHRAAADQFYYDVER